MYLEKGFVVSRKFFERDGAESYGMWNRQVKIQKWFLRLNDQSQIS